MAEIPVERKSSTSWWVWVLIALLLIGLAWWLAGDDEPEVAAVEPVAPVVAPAVGETAATPEGPITTIEAILGSPDPSALVGRSVRLDGVQVQAVPGDKTFVVGPSADRGVFVWLEEIPTPGTPVEGRVDVNPGQIVNLVGTLQSGPVDGADAADASAIPTDQDVYVRAQAVDIVQRP